MTLKLKATLIVLNSCLVIVGLYFGIPAFISGSPLAPLTAGEVEATLDRATDLQKQRNIVRADDMVIRANANLASLGRQAAISIGAVSVVVGIINVLVICFRARKNPFGES